MSLVVSEEDVMGRNTGALEGWFMLGLVAVLLLLVVVGVGSQLWIHFIGPLREQIHAGMQR